VAANSTTVFSSKKEMDEFRQLGTITRHLLSLITLLRITVNLQFYYKGVDKQHFKLVKCVSRPVLVAARSKA